MGDGEDFHLLVQHPISDNGAAAIGGSAHSGGEVVAGCATFGESGELGCVRLYQPRVFERGVRIGLLGDPFILGQQIITRLWSPHDCVLLHAALRLSWAARRSAKTWV